MNGYDPREFFNRLKAKHHAICAAFPGEEAVSVDDIFRRIVLNASIPISVKESVEMCMGRNSSALIIKQLVQAQGIFNPPPSMVAQVRDNGYQERRDERRTPRTGGGARPCPWCQDGSRHFRNACPRKPTPRSCYDCLKPLTLKGHADCPGRNANNAANGNGSQVA